MPLYLTANQKDLKSLFLPDDKYIIPEFQRPYSWGEDEIFQLCKDITGAFDDNKDYFLGNIIIARAESDKESLYLVDGQQRMVTLWIMMKVLSILLPKIKRMNELYSLKSWDNDEDIPTVQSKVLESNDNKEIGNVFNWTELSINKLKKKELKQSNIYFATNFLYSYFSDYFKKIGEERKDEFWNYLIKRVYILPIELGGNSIYEATSKALKIFETLNNRGLDLCDADIFKAKLYHMAESIDQKDLFLAEWNELVHGCEEVDASLDDLFRYYSRIIRGRKYIVKSEPNLREFYLEDENSPFNGGDWNNIVATLKSIVNVLQQINGYRNEHSEIGILCRIISLYTNKYPWSALVAYLYKYQTIDYNSLTEESIKNFLHTIIKTCYIEGSTTEVRLKIFDLIARVLNDRPYDAIQEKKFNSSILSDPKGLRRGLILLFYYLVEPKLADFNNIGFFKLIDESDINDHQERLFFIQHKLMNSLANYAIKDNITQSKRKSSSLDIIIESPFKSVNNLVNMLDETPSMFLSMRENEIQLRLEKYFSKDEVN